MAYDYDPQNIFARILRHEIPSRTLFETDHALAFEDIRPQAPVHVLVIPKGPYVSYDHFAREATDAEILGFTRALGQVCAALGIAMDAGSGFRAIANAGVNSGQEVPHFHVHLLAGRPLGRLRPGE